MQGKIIYGYKLQRLLGTGGMAEVWLAENSIGKKAAVKVLLPKLCDDPNVASRFQIEAKLMVDLNHPNIRQVYNYADIDGRPCIIMEYLEGVDLKSRLNSQQHFTEKELKKWWNQLVDALNYTHKKDVVHRDIKPGNIFVDNKGDIKLLDYGIAKVKRTIRDSQTVILNNSLSLTGGKLGTLLYMSPEQVKDSKNIDYRTDYYSLAVTFVHLITGKKPYNEDTTSDFEICEQIVYKPLDLSSLPLFWRDFLKPYLSKEAANRPPLKKIPEENTPQKGGTPGSDDPDITIGGNNVPNKPSKGGGSSRPNADPETDSKHKKWIWILAALVILLGGGIIINSELKKRHDEERRARFTEIYTDKVQKCEGCISHIIEDENGYNGNIHVVREALFTLQEIEKLEQGPNFDKMGISPVSQRLFADYKSNLSEAFSLVKEKYERQIRNGLKDDNTYTKELRERLDLMNDILIQSEQGSASDINIRPEEEK